MKTHNLKIWPNWFLAVVDGSKCFEIRRDDRGFEVGDLLVFEEYKPRVGTYTGRTIRRRIVYITRIGDAVAVGLNAEAFGLKEGFCVLGMVAP